MKTRNIVNCLLIVGAIVCIGIAHAQEAAGNGPEPAPWWMRVEEAQAIAVKWLAALTVIAGSLATLIAFVIGKVNELKSRLEKQGDRIHDLTMNQTPPAVSLVTPDKPPVTQPQPTMGQGKFSSMPAIIVGFLYLSLSGCGTPFGIAIANSMDSEQMRRLVNVATTAAANSLVQSLGGNARMDEAQRAGITLAVGAVANGVSGALLYSAASALRTKQGTGAGANDKTVQSAVIQSGAPSDMAPTVSRAVSLIAASNPSDAANEATAAALDALARAKGGK